MTQQAPDPEGSEVDDRIREDLRKKLKADIAEWQRRRDTEEIKHETDPSFSADNRAQEGFAADSIRAIEPETANEENGTSRTRREMTIGLAATLVNTKPGVAGVGVGVGAIIESLVESESVVARQDRRADQKDYFIDEPYATSLTSFEYNNPIFDRFADPKFGLGRAALHDSFVLTRKSQLIDLRDNNRRLSLALLNTPDKKAKAAILQRIAVNDNMLGSAERASETVGKIDWDALDPKTRVFSRSIDLTSTLTLNALDRQAFRQFEGFDAEGMCNHWARLGFDPRGNDGHDFMVAADTYRASVSSALQARWIYKIQKQASISENPNVDELAGTRTDWILEYIEAVNRVVDKSYGASVASDFYYWLCRPAFHALRCGNFQMAQEIASLYLDPFSKMSKLLSPKVREQQKPLLDNRAPNTQWMMLLRTVCYIKNNDIGRAKSSHKELATSPTGEAAQIGNQAVARAAADVSVALSQNPYWMALEQIVSDLFYAPNLSGGKAYYNLIRRASLG